MPSSSSSFTNSPPPAVPRPRPIQPLGKSVNPGPATISLSYQVEETTNPAAGPLNAQSRVILQTPNDSSFGPNAHLAKEFVPSSLRTPIASISDPENERVKAEPSADSLSAPSFEPVSSLAQRSSYHLQSAILSSNWPPVSKVMKPPPGLLIRRTLPVETDIFVGMSAKHRLVQIPFIGHHILEHTMQGVPICLSDPLEATNNIAFDIHLPTLGLGLHDLFLASSSTRQYAFPGFERSTNCHATLFEQDFSLSKTPSLPFVLKQSHFSTFPLPTPLCVADAVVVFDDLSAYSSHATTACSSMSSSPTLSSASTAGDYCNNDGNNTKHREIEKFVTDGNIIQVCEALEQAFESQSPTAFRLGTIGSHRRNVMDVC